MPTLPLSGCAPIPLAHYLKALGILRLVSEQLDPEARGSWMNDQFLLDSKADASALEQFFASTYNPTPVLAPWNGGSGFFPIDNAEALSAIAAGSAPRLLPYRSGITAARQEVIRLSLLAKPTLETKTLLLQNCRNSFPEDALDWIDAVFVLSRDGAKFPPLLGTGGNDGRLEFTNNFMQRINQVMDPATGSPLPASGAWLRAALFGNAAPGVSIHTPIGQFYPGAAGGANATSGFDAPSAVNPWDFILMIEGALLFAAASVKRLDSAGDGALVYPFCVRQSGLGYASAATQDESDARCEMWMPLWGQPTTLPELRAIFSEGRAQIRGRSARSGVDFAQAAVTLGVDRGISTFQRYGFQVRNGLSYFATPLERVMVRRNARADTLADIEHWLDRLRQKAGPKAKNPAPASIARALNQVECRILDLCRDNSAPSLQALLAALGSAEQALARSLKWTTEGFLQPLSGLQRRWIEDADDNSAEFRLALSLAGMSSQLRTETLWFRQHLEPLNINTNVNRSWVRWDDNPGRDVAWHGGDLTDSLNAILTRRLMRTRQSGVKGWQDRSPRTAALADVTAFIEGRTNDALLADLIWGLSLLDWQAVSQEDSSHTPQLKDPAPLERTSEFQAMAVPSSFYALLRLCFQRPAFDSDPIPLMPAILHRAINGDGLAASELAARRLRSSGAVPLVKSLPVAPDTARRTAAAILFPISRPDFDILKRAILQTPKTQNT